MRPGFVASVGFDAAHPLLTEVQDLTGPIKFFTNIVTIIILLLAWVITLFAFFFLSIQLFVTIIEFKLTTLAGFVLIPFALWNKTSFLAEKVLGNIIASGIKLMVLAIIIGIGSTIFGQVTAASYRVKSRSKMPRPLFWRRSLYSLLVSLVLALPRVLYLARRNSAQVQRLAQWPPLAPSNGGRRCRRCGCRHGR